MKTFLNSFLFIFLFFFLFSCHQEVDNVRNTSSLFTISDARLHYEGLSNSGSNTSKRTTAGIPSKKFLPPIYLNWDKAKESKNSYYHYVEIPIHIRNQRIKLYNPSKNKTENQSKLNAIIQKLIIYKDINSNINQRIVTFIPTNDFVNEAQKIKNDKYEKIIKTFSGSIEFRDLKGIVLHILEMRNGRVISKLDNFSIPNAISKASNLRINDTCVQHCFQYWETTCVIVYPGGPDGPEVESCDHWILVEEHCQTYCEPTSGTSCWDPENLGSATCYTPHPGDTENCDDCNRDTEELKQFENGYKQQMSPQEIAIYNNLSRYEQVAYLLNAVFSLNAAAGRFPESSLHNGTGDAFRHALFNFLNYNDLGYDNAKRLGDAHEEMPGNPPLEKAMDLYNNEKGMQALDNFPGDGSFTDPVDYIQNMVENGELKIIWNGQLVSSN